MGVKTLLSGKIQKGRHEITKVIISSPIILDRDKIISPNRIFSVSRNAIKQTIHSFDINIMQN